MEHLWALDTLQLSQGAGLAMRVSFAPEEKRGEVKRQVDELIEHALPTI